MGVISLLLVWDGVSAIPPSVLGLYLALPDFPYHWQYALGTLLVAWVFFALFGAYRRKPALHFRHALLAGGCQLAAGFSLSLLSGEWG